MGVALESLDRCLPGSMGTWVSGVTGEMGGCEGVGVGWFLGRWALGSVG